MKDSPIVLLLVLGVLGFIGFNWWKGQQATQTSAIAKVEEDSKSKIATLETTIKSLGDQLAELAKET